jgi:hypothetical protein
MIKRIVEENNWGVGENINGAIITLFCDSPKIAGKVADEIDKKYNLGCQVERGNIIIELDVGSNTENICKFIKDIEVPGL